MREAAPLWWQAVLFLCAHFAKGAIMAVGQEHRIVAESRTAARRPDQRAVDARRELFEMAIGPCDTECRDKMRAALRCRGGAAREQFLFDLLHGVAEVAGLAGPARRVDARRAVGRIHR